MNEGVDFEFAIWFLGVVGGKEFEGTHGAAAEIAESLDGVEGGGDSAFASEPLVDEEVAKFIRKAIGEEAGEAFESVTWEGGELIDAFPKRHVNGRDFDAAAEEGWGVFEESDLLLVVPSDRSDFGAEKSDGG